MSKPTGLTPKRTIPKSTTEKRRTMGKLAMVAIIGLLLVTTLTGCTPKAPHEQWVAAMKKVNDLDYQEYVATISFDIQSDNLEKQEFYQIFNQITFELNLKLDKEDHRFLFDFDLLYKGVNCGNLTLYCDLEKITAQSLFLGPKTFYFEWKDLQPLIEKYLGIQFQITDYFPLLLETDEELWKQVELAIYDFYAEFYQDKISAGDKQVKLAVIENNAEKTITCKELIMQLDNDDLSPEEINRLLQGLFANPAVRNLIKDKITQFITIAKNNGDLTTWPISEEELIAFRDSVDDKIEQWLTWMSALIAQAESTASPTSVKEVTSKSTIRIDQKGLWRNMSTEQAMNFTDPYTGEVIQSTMWMEQNLINPGQKLVFPDFSPVGAVNLGQTSDEEWETLGNEIYLNLFAQVMVNPLFQDFIQLSTE